MLYPEGLQCRRLEWLGKSNFLLATVYILRYIYSKYSGRSKMNFNKLKNIPGSGAFDGVCWIAFAIALAPLTVYYACSFLKVEVPETEDWIDVLTAGLFVPVAILLCGISRLACTLKEILSWKYNSRILPYLAWSGAVVFPVAGLFLLPVFIARKKYFSAAAALISALCGVFYFLTPEFLAGLFKGVSLSVFRGIYFELAGICCLVLLAGVSGAALKEKRSGKFFFPLLGIALILSGFLIYNVKLEYDAGRYNAELSSISGIPIEEATFKKMNSAGFPEWEEPVASMIRNSPLLFSELGRVANVDEGKKMLRAFEKKYSEYLKALDKFLQMKPSFVRNKWLDGNVTGMAMGEAVGILVAHQYFTAKMQIYPTDKKLVQTANEKLLLLEQWLVNSTFSQCKQSLALSMRANRLSSIEKLFAHPEWTKEELQQLIGNDFHGDKAIRQSALAEVVMLRELFRKAVTGSVDDFLSSRAASRVSEKKAVDYLKSRFYLYTYTYFHYFFCENIRYTCLFYNMPDLEKISPVEAVIENCREKVFPRNYANYIGREFIRLNESTLLLYYQLADFRRLLLLGTDIRDYWLKHGKLPEDPVLFKSHCSGHPIMYENRKNSFKLSVPELNRKTKVRYFTTIDLPLKTRKTK